MNIHIFNPEHDMALVANSPHWTSPHAGRQLREDLGWIPALWAKDGDVVIVEDTDNAQWCYSRLKISGRKPEVRFATMHTLAKVCPLDDIDEVLTWGWDRAIRHQMHLAGISYDKMPADNQLDDIRRLSGRQITMRLLPFLRKDVEDRTCGEVMMLKSMDEAEALLEKLGNVVVKSPWSCSGRGVKYLKDNVITKNQRGWMTNALRQQGELMAEPLHDNVFDFGMEFSMANGKAKYEGLSLFDTANGAYTGSLLATEDEKMEMISAYVDTQLLRQVADRICTFAEQELTAYEGPFGVDMMMVRKGERTLLNPCVELNLRRTMGHTALALSPTERGHKQVMRIAYEGTHYHLRLFNNEELLY